MKAKRKVANFSTSFLDIILGALGAFFLLLILVCVSRRGEAVDEGSRLPDNMLLFRVVDQPNFVFGKHIRFFAAIYDENGGYDPFSPICFSESFEDNSETPPQNPRLNIKSMSACDYQLLLEDKEKDASKVLIGVWVADWPSNGSVKPLLAGDKGNDVSVQVTWTDKDYKIAETIKLNKNNGFASVFFLTGGGTPEKLVHDAVEKITYRSFASSLPKWEEMKKEKNLPEKSFSSTLIGAPKDKWWLHFNENEPLALFKSDDQNNKSGAPNVILLNSTPMKKSVVTSPDFSLINRSVNDLGNAIPQKEVSYVAFGKRAICARFEGDEQCLYVYPQDGWKNASDFVDCGILVPVDKAPKWYRFNPTESEVVKRYREFHSNVEDELVLRYWADAIASPIYEIDSPITQTSPLVSSAKQFIPSK